MRTRLLAPRGGKYTVVRTRIGELDEILGGGLERNKTSLFTSRDTQALFDNSRAIQRFTERLRPDSTLRLVYTPDKYQPLTRVDTHTWLASNYYDLRNLTQNMVWPTRLDLIILDATRDDPINTTYTPAREHTRALAQLDAAAVIWLATPPNTRFALNEFCFDTGHDSGTADSLVIFDTHSTGRASTGHVAPLTPFETPNPYWYVNLAYERHLAA